MKNFWGITSIGLLSVSLAACGGGSDRSSDTGPSGTGAAPGTGTPTVSNASKDLRAFGAAWTSYSMASAIPIVQIMAGATAACPLGGQTSYDAAAQQQNARNCTSREDPAENFTGTYTVRNMTVTPDGTMRLANLGSLDLTVGSQTGDTFRIVGGDIGSQTNDTGNGDTFSFSTATLRFSVGTTMYTLSNVSAPLTAIDIVNGTAQRTTTNMAFATFDGSDTWQVHMPASLHEAGTNRPDGGSLQILRQGAAQVLNVTFRADNTLVLEGGEDGSQRVYHWTDAQVQAALKDARK